MTNQLIRPPPTGARPLVNLQQVGWLPDAALANGIRILATSGTGKTQLGVWLLFTALLKRRPFIVFDPTKGLINGFLTWIQHYCQSSGLSGYQQEQFYNRIVYCDLSGRSGYVMPFSLFQRYGQEPLSAVADRVMNWVSGMMPSAHSAPIEGYSSIVKTLYPACMIAAALQPDIQVTEIPDLLRHPQSGRWKQRFAQALATHPIETAEAVSYFQHEFAKLDKATRERRLNLLEVVLQPFRYSLPIRAMFGASSGWLDFDQVIAQEKIVLVDASGLEGEYQQQVLNWILLYSFAPYIRNRGDGRARPIGAMIDEVTRFFFDSPEAMVAFAHRFGELVHVLRRYGGIHPLCVIHQTVSQLHEQLAAHLAALGNQIIGKPADYASALLLVEQLLGYQPYVKRWDPIYMNLTDIGPRVIDYRPQEYNRQEILQIQAERLIRLKKLHFLTRLTKTEGGGQGPLRLLNIEPLLGPWPDELALQQRRQALAAASGVSVQQVVAEIQARVPVQQSATVQERATDDDGYLIPQ